METSKSTGEGVGIYGQDAYFMQKNQQRKTEILAKIVVKKPTYKDGAKNNFE